MLSTRPIRRQFGDYLCRRCLNRQYGVHLTPQDCRYRTMRRCALCNASDHLVVGFHGLGRLKMLLKY